MQTFIDLRGASGALYRFRLWPDGAAHVPIAGNYVFVKADSEGVGVLLVGATNNLSQARADWSRVAGRGATHVFTRLNVVRAERMAQHADVAAAHPSALSSEAVD